MTGVQNNGIQLDFSNNQYAQVYGEKYTKKINYLADVITRESSNPNKFYVFDFEPALGKSYYTNLILQQVYNGFNTKKFLVVKRFNEDAQNTLDIIESGFRTGDAIAITSQNWQKWRCNLDKLSQMKIIIISHVRYIMLCEDEKTRQYFTKERDTLIIDEKINFPIYTFNDEKYKEIHNILPHSLRNELSKICQPLFNILSEMKLEKRYNKCVKVKPQIHYKIYQAFKRQVEATLENKTIENLKSRQKVKEFITTLDLLYGQIKVNGKIKNQCIYNGGNISTHHPLHEHWGLQNNIILDASASLDGVYKVNPDKFQIIRQSRIIDHSESEFYRINFNSSKSKIKEYSDQYFNEIITKIKEYKQENDKVLIVCHKEYTNKLQKLLSQQFDDFWIDKKDDDDPDYNSQSIAVSWYGNLIGKNWASDFTQVWLISTPNIPIEHYLIHYLHYTDDTLGNKSLDIYKGRFKNSIFNDIQTGYIAAEMYQSLKRIQRNPKPKGKFFIVMNDEEIFENIMKQMDKAKLTKVIELGIVQKENENNENHVDQVDQFIQYILNKPKGTYPKKEIKRETGIKNLGRVLADARVVALYPSNMNKIINHYNYIEVL